MSDLPPLPEIDVPEGDWFIRDSFIRQYATEYANAAVAAKKAEIERLQARVERWKEARQAALEGGDLLKEEIERLRAEYKKGWLEAAVAWEVCASLHAAFGKGKDALFTTRHADFVKHAEDARKEGTP